MLTIAPVICIMVLLVAVLVKNNRNQAELERHGITPEDLHSLLASDRDVALFDVRLPLDVFTNSVVIPGAKRLAPEEVIANPGLIPRNRDSVVYCTCPSDKTSRAVLHRALSRGFLRIKLLKGGLEAWQARGYPVVPYDKSIQLTSG